MQYRSIPRISNSDLSEFRDHLFSYRRSKPVQAFAFGSALHRLILEPDTAPAPQEADLDTDLLTMLANKVRENRFCRKVLLAAQRESIRFFDDPDTDLPCKAQLDLLHRNTLIVDLKSTSQPDYRRFIESCERFDYDRQAAFYLDSTPTARRFVFVGIQKVAPYDLFFFEPTQSPDFIRQGRKKYKVLLRAWHEHGYRPASWILPQESER